MQRTLAVFACHLVLHSRISQGLSVVFHIELHINSDCTLSRLSGHALMSEAV